MIWHEFDTQSDCARALAGMVADTLTSAISARGRAGLAVSGGRSPVGAFDELSQTPLPWHAVQITLVDDRFVPPTHPDSNERLARSYLLRGHAAYARFTGLVSNPADIDACVAHANQLDSPLSVVMLGMGEDGHTASLFPGAAQLRAGLNPANPCRYLRVTPPAAPHDRISMTLAAILSAGRIVLLISGSHKRAVLERAQRAPDPALPVSYVVAHTGVPIDVYWHP
ncbi:6-phosphogluconolactonase [Pusillimonas sp. TS35]|nr:6-phosphogluconolactonase [Pusillimonas sp. TS35]